MCCRGHESTEQGDASWTALVTGEGALMAPVRTAKCSTLVRYNKMQENACSSLLPRFLTYKSYAFLKKNVSMLLGNK